MRRVSGILIAIVFNASFAHADDYGVLTPDTPTTCETVPTHMQAVYSVNQYTCAAGYYLPANAIACAVCPSGGYCGGGTFTFAPNEFQGLILPDVISSTVVNVCADNFPSAMQATYAVNQYNCDAGYYLPADAIACAPCPQNSYCTGGVYSFNETIAQGVQSCAAGLYAPVGMWESAQCGHILHIGSEVLYLRATKKTTIALNVDIDGDGVPDFFGNATASDVPMNAATARRLKLKLGDTVYSIYDDTVNVE